MNEVLTYKGYIGSVHFSADDNVFFGKVEGINDLVTFEGKTEHELKDAFRYMIDEHIKDCKKYSASKKVSANLWTKHFFQSFFLTLHAEMQKIMKKIFENHCSHWRRKGIGRESV
jgi:hypothetical protein